MSQPCWVNFASNVRIRQETGSTFDLRLIIQPYEEASYSRRRRLRFIVCERHTSTPKERDDSRQTRARTSVLVLLFFRFQETRRFVDFGLKEVLETFPPFGDRQISLLFQ